MSPPLGAPRIHRRTHGIARRNDAVNRDKAAPRSDSITNPLGTSAADFVWAQPVLRLCGMLRPGWPAHSRGREIKITARQKLALQTILGPMFKAPLPTADGTFVASFSASGLVALTFPDFASGASHDSDTLPIVEESPLKEWLEQTATALRESLAGSAPQKLPPLDWNGSTPFQRSVWQVLLRIPLGQTLSYAEVAQAAGKPDALRATGNACGANPIPVLVPCHRVLAANGKIGGFSGGLPWKRRLLERERIHVNS